MQATCAICGIELPGAARTEHFPCSRPPVPGFLPDKCVAWADGQHCYIALLETRLDLASDIPIGHAAYTRKVCICGAEVQRVKPQK